MNLFEIVKASVSVPEAARAFGEMKAENAALETANEALTAELKESHQESVLKRMADLQLRRDYDAAVSILERIPPEVLEAYVPDNRGNRSRTKGRNADVRE